MRYSIAFAALLAGAAIPGAALAQDAHAAHEHPTAPATGAESGVPQDQAQHGRMMSATRIAGEQGEDCRCCCCEMMQRMKDEHGQGAAAPSPGHTRHDPAPR